MSAFPAGNTVRERASTPFFVVFAALLPAALLIAGYAWDAPSLGAICGAGVWTLVTVGNVFNYFLIGGRANSEELDYFLERLHRQESESAQPDETPPETPDGAAE